MGTNSDVITLFYGVVHPQAHKWGFEQPIEMAFEDSAWIVIIMDSMFRVVVKGPQRADSATFRNEVMSVVRGVLDSLGFHLGVALAPELQGVFALDQNQSVGVVGILELGWREITGRDQAAPLYVTGDALAPFVNASTQVPLIRVALADLALAIERPGDTGFYAYRAVESARQYFRHSDDYGKDVPWSRLHEGLGYSRDELRPLADAAKARRHGELNPITEQERVGLLRLARDVIGRLVKLHSALPTEPTSLA
jgi:hypothetical protein